MSRRDSAGVRKPSALGLDYEAEDPAARDEKHPNTDMILYVRLDGNAHSMTMLQIPRMCVGGEAPKWSQARSTASWPKM